MRNNRDDFSAKTKELMAKRVSYRCSNPSCRKLTCGSSNRIESFVNIGVAAHICAAAPGGKRYDFDMSERERRDIRNGIWLCQSCAKLIDSDDARYTVELLLAWKEQAEAETAFELAGIHEKGKVGVNNPFQIHEIVAKKAGCTLTDYTKSHIFKCYELIKAYLKSDSVEEYDSFCELWGEINDLNVVIPEEIHKEIMALLTEYIEPISAKSDELFVNPLLEEGIGYIKEDGTFCLENEDELYRLIGVFYTTLFEAEKIVEEKFKHILQEI